MVPADTECLEHAAAGDKASAHPPARQNVVISYKDHDSLSSGGGIRCFFLFLTSFSLTLLLLFIFACCCVHKLIDSFMLLCNDMLTMVDFGTDPD